MMNYCQMNFGQTNSWKLDYRKKHYLDTQEENAERVSFCQKGSFNELPTLGMFNETEDPSNPF